MTWELLALAAGWVAFLAARRVISPRRETAKPLDVVFKRAWLEAIRQLGLEMHEKLSLRSGVFELLVRTEFLRVRIAHCPSGARAGLVGAVTTITLEDAEPDSSPLSVERPAALRLSKPGEGNFAHGAPELEDLRLRGSRLAAYAVLDAETRSKLADLFRGVLLLSPGKALAVEATLIEGVLRVVIRQQELEAEPDLAAVFADSLERLLELARLLARPGDTARRVAENLGKEPEARVRWQGLSTLLDEAPAHPATQEALRAALNDPSPLVRLLVAMATGEAGNATLLALATDPEVGESLAARAVVALGETMPAERVRGTLRHALEAGKPDLAQACWSLVESPVDGALQALARRCLEREGAALAIIAARVLGRSATAAAVPALREAEARGPRELKQAARQAIAEIQARLEGAEAGQLTLAGSEAGALSLAHQAEVGRVTLVGPEAGGDTELPERRRF